MNRTVVSDGVRITYRIECCPIIISTTELSSKSNCHFIETRTTDSGSAEQTTTVESTTERLTLKPSTTEPSSTVQTTSRKDQVCE